MQAFCPVRDVAELQVPPPVLALAMCQGRFWRWQESPYELIGLFYMLKIPAADLVRLMREVVDAKHQLADVALVGTDDRAARERLGFALNALLHVVKQLPSSLPLEHQIKRLIANLDRDAYIVVTLTTELEDSAHFEIDKWSFFAVRPERRMYYESPTAIVDESVFLAFPDSETDIVAAGRCFALDEWTACVFHLMRAVESALRTWFVQLGVPFNQPISEASWQELIRAVDDKIKELEQQPRSEQRAADLRYTGATSSHFKAIKNAWRNHVMHSKVKYDERETLDVLQSVAAFMRACSAKPSATL